MKPMNKAKTISITRLLPLAVAAVALLLTASAYAASPGIQGTAFTLTARAAFLTQPDGQAIYSWGYGCTGNTPGAATFAPSAISNTFCNDMQVPGPTLIVTEGVQFTVTLTNALPMGAGNTSILFPGLQLKSVSGGVAGLLTTEAAPNGSVTYTLVANSPGTRAYYSGTQGDLQVEMGMYGAIIALPKNVPGLCSAGLPLTNPGGNAKAQKNWNETDFRLADSAYDDPNTCYDREYLFQFSEIDPRIHRQAEEQLATITNCTPSQTNVCPTSLNVATEPYHPAYYMINGRSMPDNMDPNYAIQYPHQPYNGNPHMHPGELTLLRVIGQGRWQHPFHEHGNHVRILGRDGNLLLTPDGSALAGPLLFTTTTTPGLAMDGIFYWSGKGLNWDAYGHHPGSNDPNAVLPCLPDANGYNTGDPTAINYFEWCQDHNKPVEKAPFGDVSGGGPVTLPDPNILTNGAWFGGSPYLGPDATTRATFGLCTGANTLTSCGTSGTTPPSGTIANSPSSEAGFAFMWHSHNEREITTNNIFPGGMLMMMLVDSREFVIDESF
ncbi:MAG: multicopper oxidase domain-containing protein [Candidatus Sulfotelmatobacter sp.]|jgi:FtsP/CotA-like multicopper oxidase with cupredoxin domain